MDKEIKGCVTSMSRVLFCVFFSTPAGTQSNDIIVRKNKVDGAKSDEKKN